MRTIIAFLFGFFISISARSIAGWDPMDAAIQSEVIQQGARNQSVIQRLDNLEKRVSVLEKRK